MTQPAARTGPATPDRRLRFVERPDEAPVSDPWTDTVVLDTAWTAPPGGARGAAAIRTTLHDVLARAELHDELEALLNDWADAVGAIERFRIGEVSWWYRVRLLIRWDLHERMIWCYVLEALLTDEHARIEVPAARTALIDAAHAVAAARPGLTVDILAPPEPEPPVPEPPLPAHRRLRRAVGRFRRSTLRRIRRQPTRAEARQAALAHRRTVLEARLDRLLGLGASVLVIASARAFQVVHSDGRNRVVEPFLEPVRERLVGGGASTITLAVAADPRVDADWEILSAADQMVPSTVVRARWAAPDDPDIESAPRAAARPDGWPSAPVVVAGADLGPAVASLAQGYSGDWLDGQARWIEVATGFLAALRPEAVFLDREDSRLAWIAAARRVGIPVVAVQHGLIYPGHLGYVVPRQAGVTRPDLTCVFGTYERDVLLTRGHYPPASVIVTGSPRVDPDAAGRTGSESERADVRRELGVADTDRLLVVSVVHNPVAGDIYSVEMVARLLGGPLPGVHVVFKLHPQETGQTPFEPLLRGLASAGGYEAPAMTSIRDIDLYRLLRSADAHLGLYSTVLTDAVVVGVPNMIASGQAFGDLLGYVPAGVAVPVASVDELRAFMRDPIAPDPERRTAFLAAHFEPGDAAGRIAAAIRSMIDRT